MNKKAVEMSMNVVVTILLLLGLLAIGYYFLAKGATGGAGIIPSNCNDGRCMNPCSGEFSINKTDILMTCKDPTGYHSNTYCCIKSS